MPKRSIKSVTVKAEVDGSGRITGYASTFTREPDWVGDVVAKGAFAECLERIGAEGTVLPLLYNHDQSLDSFIGRVTDIREDEHGLLFTADFDDTQSAQRARQLAMDGRLAKFSFAYEILDQGPVELEDGRAANELRKLNVTEVSLVLDPCNPDTSVVEVKGAGDIDGATVGAVYVDVVPRIDAERFVKTIGDEMRDVGLKVGRRNSKADEDALRAVLARLDECREAIAGIVGELAEAQADEEPAEEKAVADGSEEEDAADTPEDSDVDEDDTEEEGGATTKGREAEEGFLEAYKDALLKAYGNGGDGRLRGGDSTFR